MDLEGTEWDIYYLLKEIAGYGGKSLTCEELAEEDDRFTPEVIAEIMPRLIEKGGVVESGDGYVLAD